MLRPFAIALSAGAVVFAAPVAAQVYTVPLGAIVVPPTQTFTPGLTFIGGTENGANFQFALTQAMTLTASSFTNSAIGNTGLFRFTSIGLFEGFGTSGNLLQSGSFASFGNTNIATLNQALLNQGLYTIAYRGTVTGAPAGVGSNITFAAAPAVPEPAAWTMMIIGFGVLGATMRRKAKSRVSVHLA